MNAVLRRSASHGVGSSALSPRAPSPEDDAADSIEHRAVTRVLPNGTSSRV